jgi:hypothetical protein
VFSVLDLVGVEWAVRQVDDFIAVKVCPAAVRVTTFFNDIRYFSRNPIVSASNYIDGKSLLSYLGLSRTFWRSTLRKISMYYFYGKGRPCDQVGDLKPPKGPETLQDVAPSLAARRAGFGASRVQPISI